jgi:uncharacterized protein GlcG (DUF336 family)
MSLINAEQSAKASLAAKKKADEIGQPMNIAVVDQSGILVTFLRMDNAWLGSIDIAIKKAKTTALFGGTATADFVIDLDLDLDLDPGSLTDHLETTLSRYGAGWY